MNGETGVTVIVENAEWWWLLLGAAIPAAVVLVVALFNDFRVASRCETSFQDDRRLAEERKKSEDKSNVQASARQAYRHRALQLVTLQYAAKIAGDASSRGPTAGTIRWLSSEADLNFPESLDSRYFAAALEPTLARSLNHYEGSLVALRGIFATAGEPLAADGGTDIEDVRLAGSELELLRDTLVETLGTITTLRAPIRVLANYPNDDDPWPKDVVAEVPAS